MGDYRDVLGIEEVSKLTDDQFLELAAYADIWIYTQFDYSSTYTTHKENLDTLSVVENRNVFGMHGRGNKDWFESRMLEQDVLVEDILVALTASNSDLSVTHDPVWVVPMYLSENEIDNPSNYGRGSCVDPNSPLPLQADSCDSLKISSYSTSSNDDDTYDLIIGISTTLSVFVVLLLAIQLYTCKRMKDENIPFLSVPLSEADDSMSTQRDMVQNSDEI